MILSRLFSFRSSEYVQRLKPARLYFSISIDTSTEKHFYVSLQFCIHHSAISALMQFKLVLFSLFHHRNSYLLCRFINTLSTRTIFLIHNPVRLPLYKAKFRITPESTTKSNDIADFKSHDVLSSIRAIVFVKKG